MNNSKISLEEVSLSLETPADTGEKYQERAAFLTRIIEAIDTINQSEEWSTLKSLVFNSRIDDLNKRLETESFKSTLDDAEIYRLQGRIFEAKKYDLDKLIETYRIELSGIKRKLTQPTER